MSAYLPNPKRDRFRVTCYLYLLLMARVQEMGQRPGRNYERIDAEYEVAGALSFLTRIAGFLRALCGRPVEPAPRRHSFARCSSSLTDCFCRSVSGDRVFVILEHSNEFHAKRTFVKASCRRQTLPRRRRSPWPLSATDSPPCSSLLKGRRHLKGCSLASISMENSFS